jgi:cytidine deaminase
MKIKKKQRKALIARAIGARQKAYAPYSKYPVGAALLAESGEIYSGANIENAAFPSSMCAERVAIFHAVSAGERSIDAIAIATENGGMPCGACRQVLNEFGRSAFIIVVDAGGEILLETSADALLPHSFGPDDLQPIG